MAQLTKTIGQTPSVRTNDITPAKHFPVEPGATYVFDKGYYDFGFWNALDAKGCRFVTRLKKNSSLTLIETRPVDPEGPDLADCVARLSTRLASSRSNPFDKPVRVVRVRIDSGREITLVSNDLDAPAAEIAALYKQRWQVELFFKWVKQNLKIRHFLGTTENAVRIQIVTALIAYVLLRLAQIGTRTGLTFRPSPASSPKRPSSAGLSPTSSNRPPTSRNPTISSKSPSPKSKPDSSGTSPGMTTWGRARWERSLTGPIVYELTA